MQKIKVLNLYAGIGGNRKLWDNVEVTAVELNESISKIYSNFFPNDKVIVGDAHQYLLEHYNEFDFIWSSPPCPTHSKTMFFNHIEKVYPDMKLYEEIIFLQNFCKGKYIVENVKSYYDPLIKPQESERHYFWANFDILQSVTFKSKKVRNDAGENLDSKMEARGIIVKDFFGYKGDKRKLLNNAIEPELGLQIFNSAFNKKEVSQDLLFKIAV